RPNGALHRIEVALVGEVVLEDDAGQPYGRLQIQIEAGDIRLLPAVVRTAADVHEPGEHGRARQIAAGQTAASIAQVLSRPLLDRRTECKLHLIWIVAQA